MEQLGLEPGSKAPFPGPAWYEWLSTPGREDAISSDPRGPRSGQADIMQRYALHRVTDLRTTGTLGHRL